MPIPRRHQFPLLWIDLFVGMVLVAATSLRAAAEVLRLLGGRLPALGERAPCANRGRMRLLRIGFYELQRPKERTDDWVWLVDHTIQWGARKCLFVVGFVCYDILHKLALFLGKALRRDARWSDFLSRAAECEKRTRYTCCAFLSPPTLRERCRTMNLGDLLRWADHVRRFLDDPRGNNGQLVERLYVNLDFAWLREFDEALDEWRRFLALTDATLHDVRHEGYHRAAAGELVEQLRPLAAEYSSARAQMDSNLEFVAAQSGAAHPGERLFGSTEALESLIGQAKRLLGPHIGHGMTRTILGAAAAVVDLTPDTIATALNTVQTRDVDAWAEQWLGPTVQSQRCRMYKLTTPTNNSGINPATAQRIGFLAAESGPVWRTASLPPAGGSAASWARSEAEKAHSYGGGRKCHLW